MLHRYEAQEGDKRCLERRSWQPRWSKIQVAIGRVLVNEGQFPKDPVYGCLSIANSEAFFYSQTMR